MESPHAGEDRVVRYEGNAEPDCRRSYPAVSLMVLLAQAVPGFDAPGPQRGVGLRETRPWPYRAGLVQFVLQPLEPTGAPRGQLRSEPQFRHRDKRDDRWAAFPQRPVCSGQWRCPADQSRAEDTDVDDDSPAPGLGHALRIASTKMRSSSSVRSSMSASSSGGSGRAAASTSSLLRSRLAPLEAGFRGSGSDIVVPPSVDQAYRGDHDRPPEPTVLQTVPAATTGLHSPAQTRCPRLGAVRASHIYPALGCLLRAALTAGPASRMTSATVNLFQPDLGPG